MRWPKDNKEKEIIEKQEKQDQIAFYQISLINLTVAGIYLLTLVTTKSELYQWWKPHKEKSWEL